MRKFVVGDIHGGYRGLIQVLNVVDFDYDNDMLISLGDVTDGWSEVVESIELLLKIKNLIYIKGNHDEWTCRFLKLCMTTGPDEYNFNWYSQGGKATYYSYLNGENNLLLDKHISFLEKSKCYHLDEENRLFVHAGLNLKLDLDQQVHLNVGQLDKNENALFYWDRKLWEHALAMHSVSGSMDNKYKEIYIGHSPTIRSEKFKDGLPANIGNLWNMDTGATYNGRLSLMNIDTKEVVQSDPLYMLYPDEMGRNGKYLVK